MASESPSRIVPCKDIMNYPEFNPLIDSLNDQKELEHRKWKNAASNNRIHGNAQATDVYNEIAEMLYESNELENYDECVAVNQNNFLGLKKSNHYYNELRIFHIKNGVFLEDDDLDKINIAYSPEVITDIHKEFSYQRHHYIALSQAYLHEGKSYSEYFLLKMPSNPSSDEKFEKIILMNTDDNLGTLGDTNPYSSILTIGSKYHDYKNKLIEITFSTLSFDEKQKPHLKFSINVANKKSFFVEFSPNKNDQFMLTSKLPTNYEKQKIKRFHPPPTKSSNSIVSPSFKRVLLQASCFTISIFKADAITRSSNPKDLIRSSILDPSAISLISPFTFIFIFSPTSTF